MEEPQRLSPEGESELRAVVASGRLETLQWPQFGDYKTELGEFYRSAGYTLAWVRDSRPTAKALAVIELLQAADNEGLFAKDYDKPLWEERLESLALPGRPASEPALLRFDLALTICTMRYILDRHLGRINPRLFHSTFDVDADIRSPLDFLRVRVVSAADVAAALSSVEPPFPAYRRLVKAVQRYKELAGQDDGEPLPAFTIPIKPGDHYSGVPRLTRLLVSLGDLPPQAASDTDLYAGTLVKAVKRFQRRHGLAPDGALGPKTLRQLNTPLGQRLRQLRLTLERWRWLPPRHSRPPIIVNIPGFRLYAGDLPPQKVVVGKAFKHQTPVFASLLTELVFRPPWNVPMSIQRRELVRLIGKDPSYLEEQGFDVLDNEGALVSSGPVSAEILERLRKGRLFLRQRPGPGNALGLVKFLMPNTHSIYLHGTPSRRGFKIPRRDLSHGCIRVDDPEALAAWVLRDQPEWTAERIRAAMDGEKTLTVKLAEPTPVLIQYGTAMVQENGVVLFFDDIYDRDAAEGAAFEQLARPAR